MKSSVHPRNKRRHDVLEGQNPVQIVGKSSYIKGKKQGNKFEGKKETEFVLNNAN